MPVNLRIYGSVDEGKLTKYLHLLPYPRQKINEPRQKIIYDGIRVVAYLSLTKMEEAPMKISKLSIFVFPVHLIMACTNIQGTYIGQEGALMDKLIIKKGHKADIIFMGTITKVSYEKTGNKVKFMMPEGPEILVLDPNGCLDGGTWMGRYCK